MRRGAGLLLIGGALAHVACGGATGTSDATGGSSTGGSATGGSPSSGGAPATGGTNGSGGEGACAEDCAGGGFVCCAGVCVNVDNDVSNCGQCGHVCAGAFPYCGLGSCEAAPCDDPEACSGNCCGTECCDAGQLCCDINIGPAIRTCSDPVDGTCPKGCPMCACAAPDTPIATPSGEVPIAELRLGDLVYSQEATGIVVVPVVRVNRTSVVDHTVLAITLENGREIRISPDHPAADGRPLSELQVGRYYDGVRVRALEPVPYANSLTYDILPGSTTGVYFAAGLPVGSTLGPH